MRIGGTWPESQICTFLDVLLRQVVTALSFFCLICQRGLCRERQHGYRTQQVPGPWQQERKRVLGLGKAPATFHGCDVSSGLRLGCGQATE